MGNSPCILVMHSELWVIQHAYKLCSQSYGSSIISRGGLVHRLERSAYIRVVPGSTPGTPTTLVMHEELCRLYKELWDALNGLWVSPYRYPSLSFEGER